MRNFYWRRQVGFGFRKYSIFCSGNERLRLSLFSYISAFCQAFLFSVTQWEVNFRTDYIVPLGSCLHEPARFALNYDTGIGET